MFNEKLVELRKLNNDTQESLAMKLNVSRSLVAKWEQGRSFPSINELNNICESYGIEFDELMSKDELRTQYGIISNKSKIKSYLIIILSSIIVIFLLAAMIIWIVNLYTKVKYSKVIMEKVNIVDVVGHSGYMDVHVDINLEDGTTLEDIYYYYGDKQPSTDGRYQITGQEPTEYEITFCNYKYSNVWLGAVTSGNYVKYENIYYYNALDKLIKTERIIKTIDLNFPTIDSDDIYDVGVYISLDDSDEFNKETCLYYNFLPSFSNEPYDIGNLENVRLYGLKDEYSQLRYWEVTCNYYLDENKLEEHLGIEGYDSINRKLWYVRSDGSVSRNPINYLTAYQESREYSIKQNYYYGSNENLSRFFSQQGPQGEDEYVFDNLLIDFNITKRTTADYYEIYEQDSNGMQINKQYIYSFYDLETIVFSEDTDRLLVCEVFDNKILSSSFVYKDTYTKIYFSNDCGIFSYKELRLN